MQFSSYIYIQKHKYSKISAEFVIRTPDPLLVKLNNKTEIIKTELKIKQCAQLAGTLFELIQCAEEHKIKQNNHEDDIMRLFTSFKWALDK